MTAAFWFQIAIAGLLVVLASMSALNAWLWVHVLGSDSLAVAVAPVDLVPDLLLAVWLVGAARGLRRGSRLGYWLSLAGLVLPLLVAAALFLFVPPAYRLEQGFLSVFAPPGAIERLLAWQQLASTIGTALTAIAGVLAVSAAGMLLTGTSRRYFGRAGSGGRGV